LNNLGVLVRVLVYFASTVCAANYSYGNTSTVGIFPAGVKLDRVFRANSHTEGPAVGPDGRIFFCDITSSRRSEEGGAIYVFDPRSEQTTLLRSPSGMAAGIKFDSDGNMVTTQGADFGARDVERTDHVTGLTYRLASLYNGRPFNAPNDLDIDSHGRIYFTDPRYFGYEAVEQPVFGVYRIDTDATVHLVAADLAKPNGIAISENEKRIYVADDDVGVTDPARINLPMIFGRMQIVAYDLSSTGALSNRKVFVDYGTSEGADGLAIDRNGNVYAAVRDTKRPGIRVYNKNGSEIAYLPTPEQPSNLALVEGPRGPLIYITSGNSLYRASALIGPKIRGHSETRNSRAQLIH
jgi:gluconolactonase